MAGSWEESTGTKLVKLADVVRVQEDMEGGNCFREFKTAMEQCDRDLQQRGTMEQYDLRAVDNRKPDEVFPVSVETCVKATAALRKCMEGNKEIFRRHIVAMDEGIEEDERRRREPDVEVEDDTRYRWWTGMMKS